MRISDWSSDVCSSDLERQRAQPAMVCELFLRQAADLAHAFDGPPAVQAAGIEVGVELVAQRPRVLQGTAPACLVGMADPPYPPPLVFDPALARLAAVRLCPQSATTIHPLGQLRFPNSPEQASRLTFDEF